MNHWILSFLYVEIYFSSSNHYTSTDIVVRTTKINFNTTTTRLTHLSILTSLQTIINSIVSMVVHNDDINAGHSCGVFDRNKFIQRYLHFVKSL